MFEKNKPFALLFLSSCVSLALANPAFAEDEEEEPSLEERVTSYILVRASSILLGSIESSLLDAIFGSTSGPAVVRIHQDSLDEIEALISAQSDRDRALQIRGDLDTFIDLIENANETFEHSGYDSSIMNGLVEHGYGLINHQGYVANEEFFKLTASRALSYSLLTSVQAMRAQQGDIGTEWVKSTARGWAVDLAAMGAAADSYVHTNVTINIPHSTMCGGQEPYSSQYRNEDVKEEVSPAAINCNYQVVDNIGNETFTYDPLRDPVFASQQAYSKLNQLRERYRDIFKGSDFNDVVSELENF